MDHIDGWDELAQKQIREGFVSRETDPNFAGLVAEAKAQGFEPAPLDVLLVRGNEGELYRWKGRVWRRCEQQITKTQSRPVAPCAPRGAADDPSEGV